MEMMEEVDEHLFKADSENFSFPTQISTTRDKQKAKNQQAKEFFTTLILAFYNELFQRCILKTYPKMQMLNGIPRITQSHSFMLSLTECDQ